MSGSVVEGPLVSVVIPTYNRADRIRAALESVRGQSYRDLEIIIVDDASSDGTQEELAAIDDPRIRLIRHEVNRGGSAARNTGIRAARGVYIAFLDSDDEWLPGKIERQVALFERSSPRVGLVYGGAAYVYPDGEVLVVRPWVRGNAHRHLLLRNVVVGSTSVAMIRREVMDTVDGFDESLPASQDMDFWLRIAEHFDVDYVPECLARIHDHDDPLRISNKHRGRVIARERFFDKHAAEMRQAGVAHRYLSEIGRIHHRRLGDVAAARTLFRRALHENALAPSTYLFLAATYVPESVYGRAGRAARRAARWLRRSNGDWGATAGSSDRGAA